MILYFEKTLYNVAQDIRFALFFFILFNELFNVGICSLFDTIVIIIVIVT